MSIPDFVERAMRAAGVDPDAVAAQLDDPPEPVEPVPPAPVSVEQLDFGGDLCPECEGATVVWNKRVKEFIRCTRCDPR